MADLTGGPVAFHSKANIFLWLMAGVAYNLYSGYHVVSLPNLLLFLPGIFVVSFASAVTYYSKLGLASLLARTSLSPTGLPAYCVYWTWWILETGLSRCPRCCVDEGPARLAEVRRP